MESQSQRKKARAHPGRKPAHAGLEVVLLDAVPRQGRREARGGDRLKVLHCSRVLLERRGEVCGLLVAAISRAVTTAGVSTPVCLSRRPRTPRSRSTSSQRVGKLTLWRPRSGRGPRPPRTPRALLRGCRLLAGRWSQSPSRGLRLGGSGPSPCRVRSCAGARRRRLRQAWVSRKAVARCGAAASVGAHARGGSSCSSCSRSSSRSRRRPSRRP